VTPHDEMLANVALYALGALTPAEAAAVAAHIEGCAECRAEYQLLRPAVTALGASAQSYADDLGPGPLLKARVMREVRASKRGSGVERFRWQTFAAIAASLVFVIGALLVDMSLDNRVKRETAQMVAQSEALADIASADAKRYRFGSGAVFVRGSHLYVALPALAAPPPGKVYQAWTLPKGSKRMAPSITFTPTDRDQTIIRLPQSAFGVAAVAVSVEPEGGSKQPTTKPIAVTVF
jgi:anti-sigma-K factor RskA